MRLLLFLLPILLSTCFFHKGDSSDQPYSSYAIDTIKVDQAIELLPGDTASPKLEININIEYPTTKGEKNISFITDKLNYYLFNDSTSGKKIEAVVADYTFFKKNEYLSLKKEYDELSKEGIFPLFNYTAMVSGEIAYTDPNLFSYKILSYFYTGGAHGISPIKFFTIDLRENSIITLHSLFSDETLNSITDLIKGKLVDNFECKSEEELSDLLFNVDELAPNENFMITEEGITWVYNQYEIAPYSFGNIEVEIPFEEIKPFIKANSSISHIIGE